MIIMDYTKNTANYLINELADNHLLSGTSIETGEGFIGIITAGTTIEHNGLYRDTAQDTATDIAWCTKTVAADDTVTYTLVATSPVGTDVEVNTVLKSADDATVDYGTVYFIGEAETNWYEFTLAHIKKRVYVEKGAALDKELQELLERLAELQADKAIEKLLEKDSAGKATISGPIVLENATPVQYTITYTDADYKATEVEAENYQVKLTKIDGSKAPSTLNAVVTNKTVDSCTVEILGFRDGVYKAEIIYTWTEKSTDMMRRISTKATLSSWFDPVIMVDTNGVYNTLAGYGMMISPASVDLNKLKDDGTRLFTMPANNDTDIFKTSKDLTKQQMINPEVLKIMVLKNWCTAKDHKVSYLREMGMTQTEAEAMAVRFMTLSEAMAVSNIGNGTWAANHLYEAVYQDSSGSYSSFHRASSTIVGGTTYVTKAIVSGGTSTNVYTDIDEDNSVLNSIKHFEALGYFTKLTEIKNYVFAQCLNLETIYLPVTVTNIGQGAFMYCTSLVNIQTLND